MFNTECVAGDTLLPMHDSAIRLYLAAKQLGGISGQSAVARALNESPQTVKNWETRGVSADGAISAELTFNCRAAWVKVGDGLMRCNKSDATAPSVDAQAIAALFDRIPELSEKRCFQSITTHYAQLAIQGELSSTIAAGQRALLAPSPTLEPLPDDVLRSGLIRVTRI